MKNLNNAILGLLIIVLGMGVVYAGDGQVDIAIVPYTISQPGSYIVTRDLTLAALDSSGIIITTSGVTLDLNGHTIKGPGKAVGTGHGIEVVTSVYNIAIRNGTVRDWGYFGIYCRTTYNSQFETLQCYNNGLSGLVTGYNSIVSGNICSYNGWNGILGGENSIISNNTCNYNEEDGICSVRESFDIFARGCLISGNTCCDNTHNGIGIYRSSRVTNNVCRNNGIAGINVVLYDGLDNDIEHNLVTSNAQGISCNPATGSFIASNRASGNTTTDYDIVAGNIWGTIINMTGGGAISTTDPYANFRF